jgi:uncharacterized protein
MMLDIENLKDLPVRLSLEDDAARLEMLDPGVTVLGKVRVDLEVMAGDHGYYCRGRAVCDADLECSRCLEPYRDVLQGEVDFSIREVEGGHDTETEEAPDDELVIPAHATEVDIMAPIREALVLAVPVKPLCREDCLGLCPICGVNHNEQTCDCKVEKADSRWDGLRDLLK